ncbi:endoglucanase [Xylariaceae sp. FL0255]|nr:endoglucanase [Xylariaceae sp. FL0255]
MKSTLALAAIAPSVLAQTLCDQYAYASANGYGVNNNNWGESAGSGSQCTYIDSYPTSGIAWHTDWTWSGGDNNVKSYANSGLIINSGTQQIVSNIPSIPTKAQWAYTGNDIRADVAYDMFTASDPNHDTSSGDYEMMIWLGDLGGVDPIGSSTGTVTVDGASYNLWVGYNGAMKVFSFVAVDSPATFESDISLFFDEITSSQGFPASSQYLISLQFGTEAFTGSDCQFNVWYWYASIE